MKYLLVLLTAALCISAVGTPAPCAAQEPGMKLEEPIAVTSCGQSPGPVRLKVFLQRLKYDFTYNLTLTAEDLIAKKETGTPFRTLFIVTGASLKGMGAAGVSIDDELTRIAALIDEAKKQGIVVVGTHIEGMSRRAQGAAAGDNSDEQSIDAVCLRSDLLFIKSDGNEDGRFTVISGDKHIPMVTFEKNQDIMTRLQQLFAK
ncbi:hypothetical protein JXO52_03525 [bacterium]|nr:hypothetical protein [bacterium]